MEKLATLAPGRLSVLLVQGLSGHHPLFEADAIRAAFEDPEADAPVATEDAGEVGEALLAICREKPSVARDAVEALGDSARTSLIRLYFRLLDRAQSEQAGTPSTH
jgi:hypothetical protein